MFKEYKEHNTNSHFVEETLNDRSRETLKEIKIGTSNDDISNKATLQCDEVLEQLKCSDGIRPGMFWRDGNLLSIDVHRILQAGI